MAVTVVITSGDDPVGGRCIVTEREGERKGGGAKQRAARGVKPYTETASVHTSHTLALLM